MHPSRLPVLAAALVATHSAASGNTVYVDATSGSGGNTTLANGSTFSPPLNGTTGNDDNWEQRTPFAAGGNVYDSAGEVAENAPELRTTVTGLTPGATYQIHVHFWDGSGAGAVWNLRAGFTANPGANTLFANPPESAGIGATAAVLASSLTYTTAPSLFTEADRTMFAAPLGSAVADSEGRIRVFIDDLPSTMGANRRAWFDGVSYRLVSPPPVTGPISYTDATLANTVRRDGQPFVPAAQGNTVIDNNWETRTLGNSGTVFESNADGAEDAPLLATTLSGLTPSSDYVLYAYFWHDGRDWRLKASAKADDIADNGTPADLSDDFLPAHPLTHFSPTGNALGTATLGPAALGTDFTASPLLTEGNRVLRQAPLGKFTADASGTLTVFIDDVAGSGEGNRVWYDGIGHKPVVPLSPAADDDRDGLSNGAEATAGTAPYLPDTDGDTYSDNTEITEGSDPLNAASVPALPGNAVEVAPDGVWTWFNDERAIVHQGALFSGYVRSNGTYGLTRRDLATGSTAHVTLSTAASQQQDDHNNPSLTPLPDGRLLALYSKHAGPAVYYQRTSLVPSPATAADWGPEITRTVPASNTYANTYRLSGESNTLYNFHRCINFNPTLTLSTDNGETWGTSRQLLGTGSGSTRPYPRYCSNNIDRIDFIYTDGHPRDVNNSVYHLYYNNGGLYKTDGTLVDTLASIPLDHDGGQRGNVIYPYSASAWGPGDGPDHWIPTGRGWTWDVHYGTGDAPVCVFQVQRDNVTGTGWNHDRIYYYYARWTGTTWQRRFIAHGGRPLYAAEDDYGGGMCLDPDDPRIVYFSSNAANPFALGDINNVPLRASDRYEIWRGFTADGGLTFSWTPVTQNSTADNLRPIVPPAHGRDELLLWFNGTYSTYVNYSTRVLGRIGDPLLSFPTWAQGLGLHGTSPSDGDQDGLDDLLEFAFSGDPLSAASRPLPTWNEQSLSVPWPADRGGIEWHVETSTDLGEWDTAVILRPRDLPQEIDAGYQVETVEGTPRSARITPPAAAGTRFFRTCIVRTD
jgi:hypothetical protein